MVTDFELAWHRLGELVASKSQHGRGALLVEMQRIAAECRAPEGELARLLRLYGVEVERLRSIANQGPAGASSSGGDDLLAGIGVPRGIIDGHEGGLHDVNGNGRNGGEGGC